MLEKELIHRPVPNGVAVLPFENLSRDPENAYLAEGIQDEIITWLAGIAGLRVISRSSTQTTRKPHISRDREAACVTTF
jgi:TolB-like protein